MRKRLPVLLVFLFFTVPSTAQERDSFWHDLNAFFDMRADKAYAKLDSTYIGRYPYHWDAHLYAQSSGLKIKSNTYGDFALSTGMQNRIGAGISYRGLSLNISRTLGKRHGLDLTLESYGRHFCFEYALRMSGTLSGEAILPPATPVGEVDNLLLGSNKLNLLYSFNPRFSYGAAMKQTDIQRRSAGSFLAGFSWMVWDVLFLDESEDLDNFFQSNYFYQRFSLGAGYAYNLVLDDRHWLLHASAVPMWTFYDMQAVQRIGERSHMNYPFGHFAFACTTRAGIYFRWGKRWSLGYSGYINNLMASNKARRKAEGYKRFSAEEWQMLLSFTCRF